MCIAPEVDPLCRDRILKRNTIIKTEKTFKLKKNCFVKNQFFTDFLKRPPAKIPSPPKTSICESP